MRHDRVVTKRGLDATELWSALRSSSARLDDGLSESELRAIEDRFGFSFAPDHRLMLSLALPLEESGSWPDWRRDADEELRRRLNWPVEGLLFDVEHDALWMPAWGARPPGLADALAVATVALGSAPVLAPLYGHRYVPTEPREDGNPVLSCYQADIIYYGRDLADWFEREFHGVRAPIALPAGPVPFWDWFLDSDF